MTSPGEAAVAVSTSPRRSIGGLALRLEAVAPRRAIALFAGLSAALEPWLKWPEFVGYVAPGAIHLSRFAWLPTPTFAGMIMLVLAWSGAGVVLASGRLTRPAAGLTALVIAYVLALDPQFYSNHVYLSGLVCLVLAVAPRRWDLRLLRTQLSIVYGYAALGKLNAFYLSGAVVYGSLPDTGWLVIPPALREWWLLAPMAWWAVGAELFLAVAFWRPRWRRAAWAVGLTLHAGCILVVPTGAFMVTFTLTMLSMYVAFGMLEMEAAT